MSGWPAGVHPKVLEGLTCCGYAEPAPVQKVLLPPLLRGENLIGQARSGSGKTVAYAAGILSKVDLQMEHSKPLLLPTKLSADPAVAVRQRLQSLVVVPTREIGTQVTAELCRIAAPLAETSDANCAVCTDILPGTKLSICKCEKRKQHSLGIIACVGGCPITYDLLAMRCRRPQIIVVTPGRFLALVQETSSSTSKKARTAQGPASALIAAVRWRLPPIKNLVLDEADRLLSEAFRSQMLSISKMIADNGAVRVLAYSATFPPPILSFTHKLVYTLAVPDRATSGDLYLITDGVDAEPAEGVEPQLTLRTCHLVTSFYDQSTGTGRVPLRMDVDQKVPSQIMELPTISNVHCHYLVLHEDWSEQDSMASWYDQLHNGEQRPTLAQFAALLNWLDSDFEHWPDLKLKFIALVMCLFQRSRQLLNKKFLVFCNDVFSGAKTAQTLTALGAKSEYISGKVSHEVRQRHLEDFRGDALTGLVCSDLIARGMDVLDVELIVSLDLPDAHDTCLHRIGRCARFGRGEGSAMFVVRSQDELQTLRLFAAQTGLKITEGCRRAVTAD